MSSSATAGEPLFLNRDDGVGFVTPAPSSGYSTAASCSRTSRAGSAHEPACEATSLPMLGVHNIASVTAS